MTPYSYSETPPTSSQQPLFQLPRSLTSPEAWISVILALLLQYNQLRRSRRRASFQRGKFIPSNKINKDVTSSKSGNENKNENISKAAEKAAKANERNQERHRQKQGQQLPFSFIHSWLFTGLLAMTSPYSSMASDLNAKMVDLKNEEELNKYTKEAVGGASVEELVGGKKEKGKKKTSTAAAGRSRNNGQTMMEIRTRRITPGEMVYQHFFDSVEAPLDLALALFVGLVSRWIFGLVRSLGLSSSGGTISPMSLSGGPCCSPYRGGDDAGTRLAGSFEQLLACVLIKGEGDEAGSFFFSLLWILLLGRVLRLGWMVSIPNLAKDIGDVDNDDDDDKDKENAKEVSKTKEGSKTKHDDKPKGMKRIHPLKAKRFLVGAAATLSSLWLFHTPILMRKLGLAGFSEAAEEWSARVILFANLMGLVSISPSAEDAVHLNDAPQPSVLFLMNIFFIFIALMWGYIASGMMIPIQETARNAAFVLSPPPTKGETKNKSASSEMFDLINTRIMLIIQALIPIFILCTYLFAERLSDPRGRSRSSPHASGGVPASQSFSKQHLQHDGLYIRVVLAWCFLLAAMFTFRPLLQSFLDQASNVASAMAALGEGVGESKRGSGGGGGGKSKTNVNANPTSKKADPFSDRYKNVVLTAGRIAVFPTFIFALLALAHIRGGIGSQHPGVDHVSKPKNAPREIVPVKGLIPPYTGKYMVWMANRDVSNIADETSLSGQSLLQAATMSHTSWEVTPFRDAAHRKVVDWAGRRRFCNPPDARSVKSLRRHVNFLLESSEVDGEGKPVDGYSVLTINAMTGRELLDMAPVLPITLVDSILGRKPVGATCSANDGKSAGYCRSLGDDKQLPTFWDIFDSISSHHILTPTVIFSVVDTMAFLGCVWWVYWYSVMIVVYWIQLKKTSALRITT
ncbi:hypothetical protein ACHAXS_013700 [Conticribra weissflogii]